MRSLGAIAASQRLSKTDYETPWFITGSVKRRGYVVLQQRIRCHQHVGTRRESWVQYLSPFVEEALQIIELAVGQNSEAWER